MKIPLRFQITEFDCGTVSITNALSYLFEREEIPAELIKKISIYTLDCYDDFGNLGQGGTSREAINMLFHWLTDYIEKKDFDLKCTHYLKEYVTFDVVKKCLDNNGCVLLRTYLEDDHYVLITHIDNEYIYMFDPYYLDENYHEDGIEIIFDKPFNYNRKVKLDKFNSEKKSNFALGPINKRECLTFNRK